MANKLTAKYRMATEYKFSALPEGPLSGKAKSFLLKEREKAEKKIAKLEKIAAGEKVQRTRKFKDSFEDYLERSYIKWTLKKGISGAARKTKKRLAEFEKDERRNLRRAYRRYKAAGKDASLPKSSPFRPKVSYKTITEEDPKTGKKKKKRIKIVIGGLQKVPFDLREKEFTPKTPPGKGVGRRIVDSFDLTPKVANFMDQQQLKALDEFISGTPGAFIGFEGENKVFSSPSQLLGRNIEDVSKWLAGEQYSDKGKGAFPIWAAEYFEYSNGDFFIKITVTDYIIS